MPLERKAPFSTTGGSKKMPPSKFKNKSGSVESLAKKNLTCSPPRQNKTPNKSGLTPIRPGKSPGTGMKLKSGLTPVRPGGPKLQSTSPFCFERKLKSGLLPIKPNQPVQPTTADFNSSMMARRKSGLQPLKPFGSFPCTIQDRNNPNASVIESRPFTFAVPKNGGMSYESMPQSASRRKSGLLPLKQNRQVVAVERQSSFRPRPSMTLKETTISNSSSRPTLKLPLAQATPALKSITEDGESPTDFRGNISGFSPLDDTVDMSVVIRPRPGHGSSRVPLPRITIDSAHCSSSDSTKTRIPKRVLHFTDEDCTVRTYANVLKDGSSKVNTMEEQCPSNRPSVTSEIQSSAKGSKVVAVQKEELLKRKKEIEIMLEKMSIELKDIDLKLRTLQDENSHTLCESENLTDKRDDSESDSPFAQVNSPLSADPLELLTLDKSKRPENIYRVFRQSCSFLKTPQPSAFRKPKDAMRFTQQSKGTEDSPNVSQRLQKQLADLFDE